MVAQPQDTHITETEYLEIAAASEEKLEFIDGEIYAMSGASEAHIRISVNLVRELDTATRGKRCSVYNSDLKVRTQRGNHYYPDATVACGEPEFVPDALTATLINPTVIFEVLSPSTASKDRTVKLDDYTDIPSLTDYVIIYQDEPRIDHYRPSTDSDGWNWVTLTGLDATLHIQSVDVTLKAADLYERVTFPPDDPTSSETA